MAVISSLQAPSVEDGVHADLKVRELVKGFLRIYRAWVQTNRVLRLAADSAAGEGAASAAMRGM